MAGDTGLVATSSTSVVEDDWNSFVARSASNGVFQTTFYGDRLVELFGWNPVFISVVNSYSGEIVGSLMAFIIQSDSDGSILRKTLTKLRGRKLQVQWFGQPTISSNVDTSTVTRVLLEKVEELCDERFVHSVGSSEVAHDAETLDGWQSTPWATYYVDVSRSRDELWMGLSRTARKAVRKSEKQRVTVRQVRDVDELKSYYTFAEEVRAETGKSLIGFRDFETMWRHLRGRGIFETFMAEVDGKLAAGLSVWGYGDFITELGAFVPQWSKDAGLNAGDAIKWEIIKWANEQGLRTYDLAGVNPNAVDDKERLIERFKVKWGGVRVGYNYVSREF